MSRCWDLEEAEMKPTPGQRYLSIIITLLIATAGGIASNRAFAACLHPEIQTSIKKSIDIYQKENPLQRIPLQVRVWGEQADIESLADQLRMLSAGSQSVWFVDSIRNVDSVQTIEEEFRRIKRGAYLVVDREFMLGDLPKYNNALENYRNNVFHEGLNLKLIFDPYLDVVDNQAIFAQLVPGHNATNLAYKIEGAAILMRFPGLLGAESFTSYVGELSDKREVDQDREQIISRCIEDFLAQRANQK
jgi:hypothetical protein